MSYLALLERARRALAAGGFEEAEALYHEAYERWRRSRVRAPLTERGLDPLLRRGARLLGRAGDEPILPNFPRRAEELRGDLEEAAQRLRREAVGLVQAPAASLDRAAVATLGRALRLARDSRLFRLGEGEPWSLARAHLEGALRQLGPVDAGALPRPGALPADEIRWLHDWCGRMLRQEWEERGAVGAWALPLLERGASEVDPGEEGSVLGRAAQLALLDEAGGPRALSLVCAALERALPPAETAGLLRLMASLAVNQHRLAGPGGDEGRERLAAHGALAAQVGIPWPPAEIEELLARRDRGRGGLVAVVAEGAHLLALRLEVDRPCDLLLLRAGDGIDGASEDPFAVTPTGARARLDRWIDTELPLLLPRDPSPAWAGVLASRPRLVLSQLAPLLGAATEPVERAGDAGLHPLLEGGGSLGDPWRPLLAEALALAPRLGALGRSPAFAAGWGRENLRRMAGAGLECCARLVEALDRLDPSGGPEAPPPLQEVDAAVPLRWPRLADRAWPAFAAPAPAVATTRAEGDLLLGHRPSCEELARRACEEGVSELIVGEAERGAEVVARAAEALGPTRVTLAPEDAPCPEPLLALLRQWVEQGGGDPARAVDALWLYRALAETPAGDVVAELHPAGRPPAREAVLSRRHEVAGSTCGIGCRLHAQGDCFAEQRLERRRRGRLWVEVWKASPPEAVGLTPILLVDDLVSLVAERTESEAAEGLDRLHARLRASGRAIVWAEAGPLLTALAEELQEALGRGRVLGRGRSTPPTETELLWVPPGYAPGEGLLEGEAEALLHERARRARQSLGASLWSAPGAPARDAVEEGTTSAVEERTAIVWVGAPGPLRRDLALLRVASVLRRSRVQVLCLDPRFAALFRDRPLSDLPDRWLPEPLDATGALILDALPTRRLPRWTRPLDEERLIRVAEELGLTGRWDAVAEAVAALRRGGRWVLGGASDAERWVLAELLARLATEAEDGGPLAVRALFWVHEDPPPVDGWLWVSAEEELEEALLEVDRGRCRRLALSPRLLGTPLLERWAARGRQVGWIVPHAERGLAAHPARTDARAWLAWLAEHPGAAGALVLAAVDDPDPDPLLPLEAARQVLDAQARSVAEPSGEWRLRRHPLRDPRVRCARCGGVSPAPHVHALCPGCGAALIAGREEAMVAVEQTMAELAEHLEDAPDGSLVVLADLAERDRLRARLGLEPFDAREAPLLASSARDGTAYDVELLPLAELWERRSEASRLLLTRVPPDPLWLRALLMRREASGRRGEEIQMLDHPLHWALDLGEPDDGTDPERRLAGRALRWSVSRAEVEFRLRQALGALGRGLREEPGTTGLRPAPDPEHHASLRGLLGVARAWTVAGGGEDSDALVEELRERAPLWIEELADAGLRFDAVSACRVPLASLARELAHRRALAHLLAWCGDEGLLEGVAPPATARLPRAEQVAWLSALRRLPAGRPAPPPALRPWPLPPGSPAGASPAPTTRWRLAPGGGGRTRWLHEVGRSAVRRGGRVLVLVPHHGGVLEWDRLRREESRPSSWEIARVEELSLAFLRHHHELGGFDRRPRRLPPVDHPDGERLRAELMRETSRRYALEAGGVPPVDSPQLRRIVESGEGSAADALAAEEGVDLGLLHRCAELSRRRAGWVNEGDLRQLAHRWLAEHPYLAEAWRDRYRAVLVDDAHELHPDQRAFVDRLFPPSERWTTADPLLLEGPPPPVHERLEESTRLPRELAKLARDLLRRTPELQPPRARRGTPRGKLRREHVLNLEACAQRVAEAKAAGELAGRCALVLGHGSDRELLAARLRELDVAVWPGPELGEIASPGPRALAAALLLARRGAVLPDETVGALQALLLEQSPFPVPPDEGEDRGARWRSWCAHGPTAPRSPAEAFLRPLLEAMGGLPEDATLAQAHARLSETHLLARLRREDAAGGRLQRRIEEQGDRLLEDWLARVDARAVADPLVEGGPLRLLLPEELSGLQFDRLLHLCTGREPVAHHLRVLQRVEQQLWIFYSDRDPAAGL